MDSIQETLQSIMKFRDKRDWAQFHTPRNLATALAIEAAELQEAMLWKTDREIQELLRTRPGRAALTRELADVLIFVFLLCQEIGVDPMQAIQRKLSENAKKYPVKLTKGKVTKYKRLRRNRKAR